ncbi:class I mannose-6-phosphate isomerase [Marinilabilia rubra]|uniref:Mannose-6-phosphate isomerase n=1 Tax=Marinilabilia rubra TaxID=2162893 RepID=A0A2U2BC48_9BACT|nr:class I mannose-6-phosphate isomerase [Marinilabilia rubra]PWE00607.1 mannose-6-phosphate isomerase [Marinilabilia rubra]
MANYLKGRKPNFDKTPSVEVKGYEDELITGWENICKQIAERADGKEKFVIAVDTYLNVHDEEIISALKEDLPYDFFYLAKEAMKSEEEIDKMTYPDVTDDDIFGYMTRLNLVDFFEESKLQALTSKVDSNEGVTLVYGPGATLVASNYDLLVYADMPRWEGQLRFKRDEVSNLGVSNKILKGSLQYKRAYFVDWRVCDRHKKNLFDRMDFVLDTVIPNQPKMISGKAMLEGLKEAGQRPFRVVPFFDPGPWGGQWMKEICDLDKSRENFAWCFDCVPEENSLNLKFGNQLFEIPSINLVFRHPHELLGEPVHARFGDEFPIRFDFLDTMQGGNLSLQVHPLTEYIQEQFGMHYTQDESYYLLDASEDAVVYLGLKEGVDPEAMISELQHAQDTGNKFDADKHVGIWPVEKHDHVLIPAGTVHCSGANSMVLEISATPYIFTFKLYDWGRMGLDGKPRPINIEHGKNVIQWNRAESWSKANLIGQVERLAEGDGWVEERTGLHNREFIETRRHWFTDSVLHNTNDGVNVLNLVEGHEAIVESPTGAFEPFVVHYAETFIIPAAVGEYTIRPYGESKGQRCGTIKAFVRTKP